MFRPHNSNFLIRLTGRLCFYKIKILLKLVQDSLIIEGGFFFMDLYNDVFFFNKKIRPPQHYIYNKIL